MRHHDDIHGSIASSFIQFTCCLPPYLSTFMCQSDLDGYPTLLEVWVGLLESSIGFVPEATDPCHSIHPQQCLPVLRITASMRRRYNMIAFAGGSLWLERWRC